jgi:hypothetical protein
VTIDPAARVVHAGDLTDVGRAVAAAFAAGNQLPDGSYLGVCSGVYSFNDFVGTLNAHEGGLTRGAELISIAIGEGELGVDAPEEVAEPCRTHRE